MSFKSIVYSLALCALIGCGSNPYEPVPGPGPNPVPTVTPTPTPSPEPEFYTGYIHDGGGIAPSAPYMLADRQHEHPLSFSWINVGYDIPVRDQGNCGSCWAHGSEEVLEWALNIYIGKTPQLSVQQIVSCDKSVYGCRGGWFSGYVVKAGLVKETEYPYTATNGSCKSGLKPTGIALSVVNVGEGRGKAPTTAQMKDAILQYGPLAVTVAAGKGWSGFKGGKMSPCTNRGTNHIVVIYGWNEDGWLMRNSWGTRWGKNGDAVMPYGCDLIGEETATYLVKEIGKYSHR